VRRLWCGSVARECGAAGRRRRRGAPRSEPFEAGQSTPIQKEQFTMHRLKILGVALMAVFVLAAVASATASAAVVVLPEKEEKWTGESGKGSLEVLKGAAVVTCAKDKSEGTFEATKPLGTFHIDFEGCKASIVACTGLGEAKEVILTLGTTHMVFDKLAAKLSENGVGVLFLVETTHFECLGKLFVVSGQVLCLIKPVEKLAKHFEIVCEKGKESGDPGETVYWNEEGKEVKMGEELLLTSENEKPGVMSGENTTALILTTNEILIMC